MSLEDELKQALTPPSPIKTGRLLTGRGGNPGETVWVEVEGSPISQRLTCATVVNSENVTVVGDRVFCASAPHTSLSRTLEYSRYRPIGVPAVNGKIKYIYSVVNASNGRDLYVGGFKQESEFIGTFPARGVFNLSSLVTAAIDNLGGDAYETNVTQIIASGNTTYPVVSGTYGFDRYSLEKNGQQIGEFGRSTLLDNNGSFNQNSHAGFGFYYRGNYRYYEDNIDKFFGIQNSEETELTAYSLAFFNGERITNTAATSLIAVGGTTQIGGTWEYALLPRQGVPFFVANSNTSINVGGVITGANEYRTSRINRAGDRGLGFYINPGYSEASYRPAWYNDDGIAVAADNAFDILTKISGQYIDLDEADDRFYLFPKAGFNITQDQTVTVETYDSAFTKLEETEVQIFKASTLGNSLIVHQASYHPD